MNLEKLSLDAIDVVEAAAAFILANIGKVKDEEIDDKSLNNLVSFVDKTSEKILVEGLGKLVADSVFLTEEETVETANGEYRWIIDPLDGTTNFLFEIPFFSISVALFYKDEPILGIVYEVNRSECFYAWKNGGAYLNGEKIFVSKREKLGETLIATGFPYYKFGRTDKYLSVLGEFMKRTRGVRRLGSAALDLAYVAVGRFDGFFEYNLNAWDVAGGAFIVKEAGGKVTDFKGGENFIFGAEILVGNPKIHGVMLDIINEKFMKQ